MKHLCNTVIKAIHQNFNMQMKQKMHDICLLMAKTSNYKNYKKLHFLSCFAIDYYAKTGQDFLQWWTSNLKPMCLHEKNVFQTCMSLCVSCMCTGLSVADWLRCTEPWVAADTWWGAGLVSGGRSPDPACGPASSGTPREREREGEIYLRQIFLIVITGVCSENKKNNSFTNKYLEILPPVNTNPNGFHSINLRFS